MENNIMQEALDALEGKVSLSPEKVPEGATVVAVEIERDEGRSGRFMTSINPGWIATGHAIALKDGHAVAGNCVFGRYTNGAPKISACHYVVCQACSKRVLQPLAVWEAKDAARKRGIEIPKEAAGMSVLKEYGSCSCGGKWRLDTESEKAELASFAGKVLDAISASEGPIPQFMCPTAFTVVARGADAKPLAPEWEWVAKALEPRGQTAIPFDAKASGPAIMFNPGFWLGYVQDYNSTNLFWVENGKARNARPAFNPAQVEGL